MSYQQHTSSSRPGKHCTVCGHQLFATGTGVLPVAANCLTAAAAAGWWWRAGMPMNQVLLRHSLCDNPDLMQRITLFGTGLGEANKDCTVVSPTTNAGNGNVVCGADVQAGMEELYKKEPAYRHEVRGSGVGLLQHRSNRFHAADASPGHLTPAVPYVLGWMTTTCVMLLELLLQVCITVVQVN
jgi:hypothetical protein